jgi:hypothetical protein
VRQIMLRSAITVFALTLFSVSAQAQEGYEFEVYGAEIPHRGLGELEFNVNFVPSGAQRLDDAEGRATHRSLRSSIELSAGLSNWLEASLYTVTYARNTAGFAYVGNRGRLTAIAPTTWGLPFEAGISQELGYARSGFAESLWAYEVIPIVGKDLGKISILVNPAFERGLGAGHAWEFEPRGEVSYALAKDRALGVAYYSVLGPVQKFDVRSHQHHQLFLSGESALWSGIKGGLGIGRGLTSNSDRWVIATRLEFSL